MTNNHEEPTVTTAEAAKILGVRSDTVHSMKNDDRLKPLEEKTRTGGLLFKEADVRALAAQREAKKAGRWRTTEPPAPAQETLPDATHDCRNCTQMAAQLRATQEENRSLQDKLRRHQGALAGALA